MSTQVLPFEAPEGQPTPVSARTEVLEKPEKPEKLKRSVRAWKRPLVLLVIQLVASLGPVAILVVAFAIAGDRLATAEVAGVSLRDLIIAIAVVTPFLSQTVAAPIYTALHDVNYKKRAAVSAAVISVMPAVAILSLPIVIATSVGLAVFRGWGIEAAIVLALSLMLNLLMGMLMVITFATRSFRGAVTGWLTYGLALMSAPAAAWWLPPLSGFLLLLRQSLKTAWLAPNAIQFPHWRTLAAALRRGLADAVPIWAIPATMWFLAPETFPAFTVFAAVIPATIGYQAFFALFAGRLWDSVGRLQHALASVGYATVVETDIATTIREARKASTAVILINLGLAVAAISLWLTFGWNEWKAVPLIVGAASAACCATTLSYQYSIISSGAYLHRTGLVLGIVATVSVLASVPPTVFLALYILVSVALTGYLLVANRSRWLQPEYSLFWSQAVRL